MIRIQSLLLICIFHLFFFTSTSFSEVINDIKISGNERIPDETILMFTEVNIGDDLKNSDINIILKKLYKTNFFENISVNYHNNTLSIKIIEAPLIQNLTISGVKAKKYKELISNNLNLKAKSSFNKSILSDEIKSIESLLRVKGFYFANVEAYIEELDNNLVNLEYKVDIGDRSKISKISFIGDKIYKNKKLKSIIVSEEYKFWKFISGKKYLQEQLINLDKRLLKNFYLNKGFYNAKVNSSFAKLINDNEFELIYNIMPGEKILFGDLNVILPNDFNNTNYINLNELLKDLKNVPYSINSVDKILDEIDKITTEDEFKTVKAYSEESIKDNKLDIDFIIEEAEKYFVEKINIYGNNITRENVIRDVLIVDEGDAYNEILHNKSLNRLKGKNIFGKVDSKTVDGSSPEKKVINLTIEEKATGEISAGAGVGTSGASFSFQVTENNYLGKGIRLNTGISYGRDTIRGRFSITRPNFNYSDKDLTTSFEISDADKLKTAGYQTTKKGFSFGTSYEQYKDFYVSPDLDVYLETLDTNSLASKHYKKQEGDYFDTTVSYTLTYDKRDQRYQPTDGHISTFYQALPIISDSNALSNGYEFTKYQQLFNEMVTSFSFSAKAINSVTGDDVRISKRLNIPSQKLKGFQRGKVGPKDGLDYVGGNYYATVNVATTLPNILPDLQNLDFKLFFDAGNLWGVDYDSSIDESNKIRSSTGLTIDWFTPIGPLNFSFSKPITKANTDRTEGFRFNLGTTF